MAITEVTVPKQYVIVQATEPSGAFEGQLWYDSTNDLTYIYDNDAWELISVDVSADVIALATENAEQQIDIIELQANASISPFDHDTLISDTFSDSTGYNDTVNAGNTTADYGSGRYSVGSDWSSFGLLHYYKMDETSGTTMADIYGTANGTHSTASIGNQTGILNKACYYSSSNVTNISNSDMNITGAISISAWIKKGSGAQSFMISKIAGGGVQQYNLACDSGNHITFTIGSTGGDVTATCSTAHSTSAWFHVVATWDGTTNADGIKIYLNGSQDATATFSGTQETTTNNTQLGQNTYAGGGTTTAFYVDELGFSDEVLSAETISALYGSGTPPEYTDGGGTQKLVELDLPTITGTITHTELVTNNNTETGASITYKLNDGTDDSDEFNQNTKNTYSLDDVPTKLKIYLTPKETDPTNGLPSIKTYCLKLWKA